MYNETTRLVKVVMPVETEEDILQGETNPILASVNPTRAAGDSGAIMLSDTAENLYIANEVVLQLDQPDAPDVESGKSFYAQMTKKVLSDGAQGVTDGYYFTFDTGDVFFSATANGYPELVGDTLNIGTDNGGGGSGGGVLVVQSTVTGSGGNEVHTLDKTWKEIADAGYAVVCERQTMDDAYADFYGIITGVGYDGVSYFIIVRFPSVGQAGTTLNYTASLEDSYPNTLRIS